MPGLTVEYLADNEAVTERASGMFVLNGSHQSAPVAINAKPNAVHPTHRSERVTLAVVMSMTHVAAAAARALCWLRRDASKGV